MEKMIYELRPYAYMSLGFVALIFNKGNPDKVALVSSLLLMACAASIIYWRHSQRAMIPRKFRKIH